MGFSDDSGAQGRPGDLCTPFIFVPHGDPEPLEWMAEHPGWVKFPAVMVPRPFADAPQQPVPASADVSLRAAPAYYTPSEAPPETETEPFSMAAFIESYNRVSRLIGAPLLTLPAGEALQPGPVPGKVQLDPPEPRASGADVETSRMGASLSVGGPQGHFSGPVASIPFADDQGRPILNQNGKQMVRPSGWDAQYFIRQGERAATDAPRTDDNATSGLADPYEIAIPELMKFRQYGPWDAQRIGGKFREEFRDFATVVIGLYGGSAELNIEFVLEIENLYAGQKSNFPPGTVMDRDYPNLPAQNVWNTRLGYDLYTSGRIR